MCDPIFLKMQSFKCSLFLWFSVFELFYKFERLNVVTAFLIFFSLVVLMNFLLRYAMTCVQTVMMVEKLQNRRLVFVGDSMGRNQWQALLCMLSSAIAEKDSIYEVNGNTKTKHTRCSIFKFKPYNCTVEYCRSPFLVLQGQLPSVAIPTCTI